MAALRQFEDVKAWQHARELTGCIYATCRAGTLAKDFGLRDQLQRAAVSVMSNIAEGFGRRGDKQFAHFLDIAHGSAAEVQSLLYVALDAGHLTEETFRRLYVLADETAALVTGSNKYLRRN
ncbi:MAG: four helix bundle protein [Rhodothermales bacterium]